MAENDSSSREAIAARLRKTMTERGIKSVAELARVVGIKEVTMRSYLNGLRLAPLDQCHKIGRALGISGDWLANGEGEVEGPLFQLLTPTSLIKVMVEEACLLLGHPRDLAAKIGGRLELIVGASQRGPQGMSHEEAVRAMVRAALYDIRPA